MGSYKLNKEAENNVIQLYRYGILNFGLDKANSYYEGLFERFEVLAQNPFLYGSVDHIRLGYRLSVYRKHSIYYRVNGNEVQIMGVLGRQNPTKYLV